MPHRIENPITLGNYTDTPDNRKRLYRRTLYTIVAAQLFGGAGLAAGIAVGALLAREMLGSDQYAGVPSALITLGSAVAAWLIGRLSQQHGRRVGIAAGFLAGGVGSGLIVAAAAWNMPLLFFASLLLYGAGTATNFQARYAGADLAEPSKRATAVSIGMVATTFGAVAGPNLIGTTGGFAASIGLPALSGPFLLSAAAFLLAGIVPLFFLRPDPYLAAKAIAAAQPEGAERHRSAGDAARESANRGGLAIGTAVMILTQIVMVAIMTMTPVHMEHHGHGLDDVGLVIGLHIGMMFLPSLFTGMLVDKIGRIPMSIASGAVLLASGVLAAYAPADSVPALAAALALLGLGWNLGFISGTAMIVDATHPAVRAKTQGKLDILLAVAGASGGAASGMVVAHSSYTALALGGGILSLLLVPVVIRARRQRAANASNPPE